MTDWWLDEQPYVGDEHLDPGFVEGYDGKGQFDPTGDIDLLVQHGLGSSSTVVDLGAGTGTFAVAAGEIGATVWAVDPSPVMADAIRAKTDEYPNIRAVEAGVLSYQHHGEAVDFVYSRNTLHQLPDFWKVMALVRIADLLRGAGVFLLRDIVYDTSPANAAATIDDWLDSAATDPSVGYTREDLRNHITGEFSTFTWMLEEALQRTGFEVISKSVRQSVYATYLCRR